MFLESNSLILVIVLVSLCAVVLMFSTARQVAISNRSKINYENFLLKKRLYCVKPLLLLLIAVAIIFVYSIVLTILTSLSNVTRIYLMITIPVCLVLAFLFVNELRISSKNKDLSFYSSERSKIDYLLKEKNDALDSLLKYETQISQIKEKWSLTIGELNSHISIIVKNDYCDEIMKLESLVDSLKDKVSHLDGAFIEEFSTSLSKYLETNIAESINTPAFDSIDKAFFDGAVVSAEKQLKELILSESLNSISKKQVPSVDDLIDLIKLNISLSNDIDSLVFASFEFVDEKENKSKYVEYLYSINIITFEMILDCLNKKQYWIFDVNPFSYFEYRKNLDLITFIIDNELMGAIYPLLRHLNQSNISLFSDAISKALTKNKCTDLVSAYIDLLKANFAFGHESNIYENMAFALASYYKNEKSNKYNSMKNIIDTQSFVKNKQVIVEEYLAIRNELEEQKINFVNCYISYMNSKCLSQKIFKPEKMIALFSEYLSNLNKNKLVKMVLLVHSVILLEESNESIIKETINSLSGIALTKELYSKKLTTKDYQNIGKTILNGLLTKYNKDSLSIINRIEDERLCYEKLARMWGTKYEKQGDWKGFIYLQSVYWHLFADGRK